MTNTEFKRGLQSELKAAGFGFKILKVDDMDCNTTILFDRAVSDELALWLMGRFTNGITTSPGTMGNLVILLTPKQARDLGIKGGKA